MPNCRAAAELNLPDASAVLARLHAELDAQDLDVHGDAAHELSYDTGIGQMHLRAGPRGLRIEITSDGPGNLHMLREGIAARLDQMEGRPVPLQWTGDLPQADHPPNFRVARVIERTSIAPRFIRLRLAADGLEAFARSGLHFRLLIPPGGRAPVWPRLGAGGRTIWPTGDDALHAPAYTIRRIDPDAGHFDVDILVHGQGPTCQWAAAATPGTEVGISGPGGGWLPTARRLVLAGDETALPAIARILEEVPADVRGDALIEVQDPADAQDLMVPPGMRLRWLVREHGEDLLDALRRLDLPPPGDRFVWFAAEKAQATEARRFLRETAGFGRKEAQAAAYWTRQ